MYQQENVRDGKEWGGIFCAAAILGTVAISSPVYAGDETSAHYGGADVVVYVRVNGGCSRMNLNALDVSDFDAGATFSRTDACFHITQASGGLQFHPNFAAEIGYVNVGKFDATAVGTEGGIPITESAQYKVRGYQVALVGSVPIAKDFDFLGRIGFFRWDLKFTSTGIEGGVPFSRNESSRGTDLTYGLGVRYNLNRNVGVSLEWQRFNNVGNQNKTGEGDVDTYSLGLTYKFW